MKWWLMLGYLGLMGCAPLLAFPSAPANLPQRKWHSMETERREPRFVVMDGRPVAVVDKVERTFTTGLEETRPPKTLLQKVWSVLGPWALLWGALMVAGLFFPPVAVIMGLVNRGLGKGTQQIVSGLEKALAKLDETNRQKVLDTLSMEYDTTTKQLVKKLRNGGTHP